MGKSMTTLGEEIPTNEPSDNTQASSDGQPESEQVSGDANSAVIVAVSSDAQPESEQVKGALAAAAQQWETAADSDLSKPATADDTSTEPLLKSDLVRGKPSDQEPSTDESYHARLLIMLCLASIACAAFMPYSTF